MGIRHKLIRLLGGIVPKEERYPYVTLAATKSYPMGLTAEDAQAKRAELLRQAKMEMMDKLEQYGLIKVYDSKGVFGEDALYITMTAMRQDMD